MNARGDWEVTATYANGRTASFRFGSEDEARAWATDDRARMVGANSFEVRRFQVNTYTTRQGWRTARRGTRAMD